jgi:hypothetical protein
MEAPVECGTKALLAEEEEDEQGSEEIAQTKKKRSSHGCSLRLQRSFPYSLRCPCSSQITHKP